MRIFNYQHVPKVLAGEYRLLQYLFVWDSTPQGHDHWYDRAQGLVPLSDEDRAYLERLYANAVRRRLGVGS